MQPPPVHAANVRFADLREGWAFGNGRFDTQADPGLWRTHDGGLHWKKVLPNPVPSLEVGGGSVWAIVLDLGGTFPQVFRGSAQADTLQLVTQAGNRSAVLTLGHGAVYVIGEQGAGPIATTLLVIDPDGRMHRRPSPCRASYEHGLGASDLQLAVGTAHHVVAICSGEPGTGEQFKVAYGSSDDGRTWHRRADPPEYGYTGPGVTGGHVAATSSSAFMTGGRSPVSKEAGAGAWHRVLDTASGAGFDVIGFTDDAHGVALGHLDGAWVTADAGEHWRRLRF
jgi:hypothetical protein